MGESAHSKQVNKLMRSAIISGDYLKVNELITSYGLSYSPRWLDGYDLLRNAVEKNRNDIANLLLSEGCPIDSYSSDKNPPLFYAMLRQNREMFNKLIERGSNVNATGLKNTSLLHLAVDISSSFIDILLNEGANINSQDDKGKTALFLAVENNNISIIQKLLNRGANADIKCYQGITPLHMAVLRDNSNAINLLIAKNAFLDSQCSGGKTALHIAIERANWSAFKILIEKGASVDITDNTGVTPLHLMAQQRFINGNCGELCINNSNSINEQDNEGKTALHIAIEKQNWAFVRKLIWKQALVDVCAKSGENSFHAAAKEGAIEEFEFIVNHGVFTREGLKSKCNLGWTPLDVAVKHKKTDIVYLILSKLSSDCQKPLLLAVKSGDIELLENVLKDGKEDEVNQLVFHAALREYNSEIVEKLLEFGFEVDPRDVNCRIILTKAIIHGNSRVVEDILKYDGDLNRINLNECDKKDGFTPLSLAAIHGQDQLAKLLLNSGAEVNFKDTKGNSPIFYAAKNKDLKTLKVFLSHNADFTEVPNVLTSAVEKGDLDLVKLILTKGGDVNAIDGNGRNALHCTALGQDEKVQSNIAEVLLSAGANINALEVAKNAGVSKLYDESGYRMLMRDSISYCVYANCPVMKQMSGCGGTAIHAAIEAGFCKLVEILLLHNADMNLLNHYGENPLHTSARVGDTAITSMLLSKGADIESVSNKRAKALNLAVAFNRPHIVKILCEAGADVNTKNHFGSSPVNIAAMTNSCEIVNMLIEFGANVENRKDNGRTPLNVASAMGNERVVALLLQKGANIENKDEKWDTSLHLAVAGRHTEVVNRLLKGGALIECKNKSGRTPLHTAAENGHEEVVALLLENNADVESKVDCGPDEEETPLHLAAMKDRSKVVSLLLEKGANLNSYCKKGTAAWHTVAMVMRFDDFRDVYIKEPSIVRQKCFDILLRYVVMMKAINIPVHLQLLDTFERFGHSTYPESLGTFEEELALMKSLPIGNSTFFKFLKKDINQLVTILKNEDNVAVFRSETYKLQFPTFSGLLSNHFHKCLYRLALIKKVIANSSEIFPKLPEEVVEEILIYLNRQDLINIVDCFRDCIK